MSDPPKPATPLREPLEALRAILPARAFADEELRDLLPLCQVQHVPKGEAVMREGEPSDNRVYFILQGSVSVSIQDRFILRLHSRGETIGEMGLISSSPRSATVRTDEDSDFLVLDATLPEQPQGERDYKLRYYLGRIFNSILTEKLRVTSDRARLYEDVLTHSRQVEAERTTLEGRIAEYLQQISLYSHLVNSAHDAIVITDTEGRVLIANRALTRLFGMATEAVIGSDVTGLLGSGSGAPDWQAVAQAAHRGGWDGEVTLEHPTEGPIPADCSVSVVHDADAALLAYSVILRDIRERKALEAETRRQAAELERAYGQLQEMDRVKSNFLSMVSHELRTPVANVLAYSEMLNMEGMVEPEERGSFLEVIHREAERLRSMVDKVLAISKMESGQMHFNFAPGALGELVRTVGAMARPGAEAKGLSIDLQVDEGLEPVVMDEENLREAVSQLVENAIKYSEQGAIGLRVERDGDRALIRVTDVGKGIEGLEIEQLLEKFGRGVPMNLGEHGLGLGLPLCYLIVKAHSGALRLASRGEQGTEAIIALPLQSGTPSRVG